jgi:cation transport ATPase
MTPDKPRPERRVLDLPIAGMTCAACSTRLENNLNRLDGVRAGINLAAEKARIEYDPEPGRCPRPSSTGSPKPVFPCPGKPSTCASPA